jgi:hypothetical protein
MALTALQVDQAGLSASAFRRQMTSNQTLVVGALK